MKNLTKALLALVATSAVTVGANAAVYQQHTTGYAGQPYIGLKVGQANLDLNTDNVDNDDPTAYGIYGGYQIDPQWGIEAEYVGADKEDVKVGSTKVGEVKQHTFGAYGTYKYTFPSTNLYAKGKLGLAQNKVEYDASNSNYSSDSSKTGLAGGIGLGYNVSPMVSIEAEYAMLPSTDKILGNNDADTSLMTVGAHMRF